MLRTIREFIGEITGGDREPVDFDESEIRLAAAALLVHVIVSDNDFNEEERRKLHDVLAYRFELGAEEAEQLVQSAVDADREAVDLYQFTSLINRKLDEEGRRRIVEMMFEVGYADGELSEFEDNVVWRASELLHVPARERVTIRRRVRGEAGGQEN